jgi:hypothetical protein
VDYKKRYQKLLPDWYTDALLEALDEGESIVRFSLNKNGDFQAEHVKKVGTRGQNNRPSSTRKQSSKKASKKSTKEHP